MTHQKAMSFLLVLVLALGVGVGALVGPGTAEASVVFHHSSCWGEGCTDLYVVRDGKEVTIKAHGFSYAPGRQVWVQINVEVAATRTMLYSQQVRYTVRLDGRTVNLVTFIDCGPLLAIQAWTWKPLSTQQPEVQTYI